MNVAVVISAKGFNWVAVAKLIYFLEKKKISYSIFTPGGVEPVADPYSLVTKPILGRFGFGSPRKYAPERYFGTQLRMNLNDAHDLNALNVKEFNCLYVVGDSEKFCEKTKEFLDTGKKVWNGKKSRRRMWRFLRRESTSAADNG